jgi:hypothetical protein
MATNTFVELDLPEAETFAALTGIEQDLETTREFAQLLISEVEQNRWSLSDPLTTAILVRYSRPFVSGVRERLADDALSILSPTQRNAHDYFRAWRDKHIAHSVNAFEENKPVARFWVERVHTDGIEQISCQQMRVVGLGANHLREIIELTSALLQHVKQRLKDESDRLLKIVRQMPIERVLARQPTVSSTTPDPRKPRRKIPDNN